MTDGIVRVNGKEVRYPTRLKFYCGELAEIMMVDKAIFHPGDDDLGKAPSTYKEPLERVFDDKNVSEGVLSGDSEGGIKDLTKEENALRAKRRARKTVFDLAMCNSDLDLFITFTLDGAKIDRYDYKPIIKKLNTWLDNRVRRRGLKYIFVAEHHKDGAIHFHGVVNSSAVKLAPSGTTDKRGHEVFNVTDWVLGFSTAIYCYGGRDAVCKYICKYITKSGEKVGGRWYYSGGELEKPTFAYCGYAEPDEWSDLPFVFKSWEYEVESTGYKFKVLENTWKEKDKEN